MESRKNKSNKFVVLILAFVMITLTLAGCRRSGGDAADGTKDGFVYVPEYIQIDFGLNSENMYVSDTTAVADSLYLIVSSWGEETGSEYGLYKYNFTDGKTERLPLDMGENDYVSRMTAMPDGNLAAIINNNTYDMDENGEITNYSSILELRVISTEDGSVINSQDITSLISEENPYIQQFVVDGKGNYYFYNSDQNITIADSNLQKTGDINTGDWINDMVVSREGDVYVGSYGETGLELKKVDLNSKSLGEKLEGISSGYGNWNYFSSTTGSILVSGEKIGIYDIASATEEVLFSWLDVDVNNNYIDNVGELSDGRIWSIYQDYEEENSKPEILVIKKVEAAKATHKEEVTYGTVSLDWDMKRLIINFNKSNEKYRIVVKEYGTEDYQTGITQLNADMTTANCPDIINLSNLNYTLYANKGILENLYPYMEKSGLKKSDYVENVLTAYEVDGKLYAMIPEFYVSTILAKKSIVGDVDGWTLSEMLDFAEANNPENLFSYGSRYSIFYSCIYNNIDEFIDWETGKCSFDGEEFIRTLEFAAKYPDPEEVNYNEEDEGTYARLKANKILLMDSGISSVQQYQMFQGMFGEEIAFVGYPNHERQGNLIMPSGGCIGISSKSKHKEGAWEFIQNMISKEYQENRTNDWGFPIMKSALEKKFEEDMTPEYYEDENGEQVENTKTSWGYDDFNIDIYAAKQEDIDTVRNLLESADKIVGSVDEQLTSIITEEADPFFKGQKSAADVANIIQNRIQIYVNENR